MTIVADQASASVSVIPRNFRLLVTRVAPSQTMADQGDRERLRQQQKRHDHRADRDERQVAVEDLERRRRPQLGRRLGRVGPVEGLGRVGLGHRRLLISQRSGKMGWNSVVRRYSTPAEPPVPRFVPIVRSTIFTWR